MKKFIMCLILLFAIPVLGNTLPEISVPVRPKTISFSLVSPDGTVEPFVPNWVASWIKKNAKKYPDVAFSQEPITGSENFMVVISEGFVDFTGFQARVVTTTTPISGSGYVSNYGHTWYYTYNGTVVTTQRVFVPYTVSNRTLTAAAFDENGTQVGSRNHTYSGMYGGDPNFAAGYNFGMALRAINARGRMLSGIVKDIEGTR
jgi:hypothetical protein